jgi:hypothetical protein
MKMLLTKTAMLRAGRDQLNADYRAAFAQFFPDPNKVDTKRAFCLGVVMCTLALKHFVEEPKSNLLPGMTAEESMEFYFEAARQLLHED